MEWCSQLEFVGKWSYVSAFRICLHGAIEVAGDNDSMVLGSGFSDPFRKDVA